MTYALHPAVYTRQIIRLGRHILVILPVWNQSEKTIILGGMGKRKKGKEPQSAAGAASYKVDAKGVMLGY
jgi:hypothetical protein